MTKAEQIKMNRLELENREFKAAIEKHMDVYRDQLYELVDLRIKLEMVEMSLKCGDE